MARDEWLQEWKQRAQQAYLYWAVRPGRIRRHVAARAGGGRGSGQALRRVDPRNIRLGAVQMALRLVGEPEDYAAEVTRLARACVDEGAQLVAFPEDAAAPLLGLLPGAGEIFAAEDPQRALARVGEGATVLDVLRFAGPAVARAYLATFRALARSLGVYVHGGSAMLPNRQGHVYNVSYLFGPDGRVLGRSHKAHLLPVEADWGIKPGDGLQVVETLLGRVGMPVCMDATYWESFRILYLRGADLAVLPTANPEPYDPWRELRGLWARLQESPMYGIHSCLVGRFLGMELTGRSGVFGPYPLSPGGNGVWARVADPRAEGTTVAAVDVGGLHEYREREGFDRSLNPILYERYLPEVYLRLRRRMRQRGRGPRGGRSGRR